MTGPKCLKNRLGSVLVLGSVKLLTTSTKCNRYNSLSTFQRLSSLLKLDSQPDRLQSTPSLKTFHA